jgi:predicted transposase YbfD/YdcC
METGVRGDRRVFGVLAARLRDLVLEQVKDPRDRRGRQRTLRSLLVAVLTGLVSGRKSLAETEELTANLPGPVRRSLGLSGRVPDTTMRDVVVALDPEELRQCLYRQVRAAHRRKQLPAEWLPFGVLAVDGKCTSTPHIDDRFAQRQTLKAGDEEVGVQGLTRTLTACLISSRAKVCVDAAPIPAETNEMGHFGAAFHRLVEQYGRSGLFEMVTLDAGFNSAENAQLIHDAGYGYLMHLSDDRRDLTASAIRMLGHRGADQVAASTTDKVGSAVVVRRLWMAEMTDVAGWPHLRRVLRVQSEKTDGDKVTVQDRYYATNYGARALSKAQWLALVRSHWAVENNCHWVWDAVFKEDDRPWVYDPQGMVVVMLMRRIAYNMLAVFRAVTLRGPKSRATPWPKLLRAVYRALIRATAEVLDGLRSRRKPAAVT